MNVELRYYTPLYVAAKAIRTCWDSGEKSDSQCWDDKYSDQREWVECGPLDKALIDRVGNKNKHSSTLEHLYYNFHIYGMSRACLQELARHRIASLSVKSTRYTLKELKSEEPFSFLIGREELYKRASKYVHLTDNGDVNVAIVEALERTRQLIVKGYSNDIVKYTLPEAYTTQLAWSINARSLQNFLSLRSSKSALAEIRNLAKMIYNALPEDHKYLFIEKIESED